MSNPTSRPTSAQGVRGTRGGGAYGPGISSSDYQNQSTSSYSDDLQDERSQRKTANENYFATLGSANSSRSTNLPPSQGTLT